MTQESSTSSNSTNMAKPKKRWLTIVLLLILIGVGLFGIDKAVGGKFFKAVKDTAMTTIGGGMNEQQKVNVDKFQKRLSELRNQRESIAKGEVNVAPAAENAVPDSKPAEEKPDDAKPVETEPAAEDKPADATTEKKDGE